METKNPAHNITVNNPEFLNHNTTKEMTNTVDLSQLSEKELAAELKRRTNAKAQAKEDYKSLTNEVVPGIFKQLAEFSAEASWLKAKVYDELKALIELKFEAYGVKTDQQSHTFTTDAGESVIIGYNVNPGYDDTMHLGVAKVKGFINSLAKDEDTAKLINQLTRLLRPNKNGDLDPKRVLELKQMANEYNNPELAEGVEIIENAYRPQRSTWYIQARHKNGVGIEVSLPLSMAAAPFPDDYNLSFLLND